MRTRVRFIAFLFVVLACAIAVQALVAGQRSGTQAVISAAGTRPAVSKDSVRFLVVGDVAMPETERRGVA